MVLISYNKATGQPLTREELKDISWAYDQIRDTISAEEFMDKHCYYVEHKIGAV